MKSESSKELANLLKTTEKLQKLSVDFNELGPAGIKVLMKVFFLYGINKIKGLNVNLTLRMLSVKGNFIGDEGAAYIAESLENNKIMQELDISFNEIGPKGFADIIRILPNSNLISLLCNRNPLGDECLIMLSTHVNNQESKLRRVEMCTCKLSDKGFAHLLQSLQNNKLLSYF